LDVTVAVWCSYVGGERENPDRRQCVGKRKKKDLSQKNLKVKKEDREKGTKSYSGRKGGIFFRGHKYSRCSDEKICTSEKRRGGLSWPFS